MKTRFVSLVLAGALASAVLTAQTKVSGTLSCTKADPVYSIPVGDPGNTAMNLVKVPCTWSKSFDMAGVAVKDGYSVAASEAHDGKTKEHGIHVGTMANGDKYTVHFQGTGSAKPDHSGNAAGTWTFDGGAGKLKGLTGKGTYKTTANADGTSTSQIEGEYKLP